jgi:hypothetical protein
LLPVAFQIMKAFTFFSVALDTPRRAEKDWAFSAGRAAAGAAWALTEATRATGAHTMEADSMAAIC